MGITIGNVYPWGRSFDEYRRMFALTEEDLGRRIVGVADGPAAFNAEMARRGNPITSCDPLYRFEVVEIRSRIEQTRDLLVNLARKEANRFVWDRVGSPENLGRLRMAAMSDFLADYERGRREGRYLDRSLPNLEFADGSFDIALCSHFLLLYSHEFFAGVSCGSGGGDVPGGGGGEGFSGAGHAGGNIGASIADAKEAGGTWLGERC